MILGSMHQKDKIKHKGHTLIVLSDEAFTECEKLCEYLLKKLESLGERVSNG